MPGRWRPSRTAVGLGNLIVGYNENTASGHEASVSGGDCNEGKANRSSVLGGFEVVEDTERGCHPDCSG